MLLGTVVWEHMEGESGLICVQALRQKEAEGRFTWQQEGTPEEGDVAPSTATGATVCVEQPSSWLTSACPCSITAGLTSCIEVQACHMGRMRMDTAAMRVVAASRLSRPGKS